jgi:hypothetical protein
MLFRAGRFYAIGILCALVLTGHAEMSAAQSRTQQTHDGAHDFDFDFGTWKTHSSRLLHPLTRSNSWIEMDGITKVKKVWDGRANLAEYKADGPSAHVELLSLRFYNPNAQQWGLAFATPNVGVLSTPSVGEFKGGRGEFYDRDELNGRHILVRFSIWSISPKSAESEQAFSDDGGKTWEVNWINRYTKISDSTEVNWGALPESTDKGAHDFDFKFGEWQTHIQRTLDPFSEALDSIELNGTVKVRKVWGGSAALEEIEADGVKGHWEALTLFLYNPKAHQWTQNFVNAKQGVLNLPLVGDFKEGRGELVSQDTFKDRSILVRGAWSEITRDSHSYEESYSDDLGTTWKRAFIAHLTRTKQ